MSRCHNLSHLCCVKGQRQVSDVLCLQYEFLNGVHIKKNHVYKNVTHMNGGSLNVSFSRPAWTAPTSALCSSPTSRCPTRARTCALGATALVQIVLPLKSPCSKVRCRTESLRVAMLLVILLSSLDLIVFFSFYCIITSSSIHN